MAAFSLNYPTIDLAMAQFEGFNLPGSIAARNLNPGNLTYGPFAVSQGAIGRDPQGYAIFPSVQTGYSAQDALITSLTNQGYSLTDIINRWAPSTAPGNTAQSTQNYIDFVSSKTGLNPSTSIADQISSLYKGAEALAEATGFGWNPFSNKTPSFWPDVFGKIQSNPFQPFIDAYKTFSWSRVAAFLLGLIFIAAGLYMFKPVREVVNTTITKASVAAA